MRDTSVLKAQQTVHHSSVPLAITVLLVVDLMFHVQLVLILHHKDLQQYQTVHYAHQEVTVLMKDSHKYLVCVMVVIIVQVVICHQIPQCISVKLVLYALKAPVIKLLKLLLFHRKCS